MKKADLRDANNNQLEEKKVPGKMNVIDFDYKSFWKEKQTQINTNQ